MRLCVSWCGFKSPLGACSRAVTARQMHAHSLTSTTLLYYYARVPKLTLVYVKVCVVVYRCSPLLCVSATLIRFRFLRFILLYLILPINICFFLYLIVFNVNIFLGMNKSFYIHIYMMHVNRWWEVLLNFLLNRVPFFIILLTCVPSHYTIYNGNIYRCLSSIE